MYSAAIVGAIGNAALATTMNYIGAWSSTTAYSTGNVVIYKNQVYYAVAASTNVTPIPTATQWKLLGTNGMDYRGAWNNATTYQVGSVVTYNSQNYYSLLATNLNKDPNSQTSYWALIGTIGNTVVSGAGAPLSTQGVVGDFWIDTTNKIVYGPKTSSGWPLLGTSMIGTQGPMGNAGPQGAAGAQGLQGPQGAAGAQGSAGAQGTPGPQGAVGPQGSAGTQGMSGPQGSIGPQGPAGHQGAVGPQGSIGPQGSAGSQGTPGPQGSIGPQGPAGSQGTAGPQGSIGPQGSAGSQGTPGPQGPQGTAGAQGAQGPQGSVGPQGTAGAQGTSGPQGALGPQGSAGAQGAQGPQGSVGPQGTAGAQGTSGPQGALGPQGSAGAQGAQGPQGSVGPQGTAGAQGALGPKGDTGPQGAAGPQGSVGAQGPQGPGGLLSNLGFYHARITITSLSPTFAASVSRSNIPSLSLDANYIYISKSDVSNLPDCFMFTQGVTVTIVAYNIFATLGTPNEYYDSWQMYWRVSSTGSITPYNANVFDLDLLCPVTN